MRKPLRPKVNKTGRKKLFKTVVFEVFRKKQEWMTENLRVSKFRNGEEIPLATSYDEWQTLFEMGKPASCYPNFDPALGKKFGRLYNWYAVNYRGGLAPAGWTIPSDDDWANIIFFLTNPIYNEDGTDRTSAELIAAWYGLDDVERFVYEAAELMFGDAMCDTMRNFGWILYWSATERSLTHASYVIHEEGREFMQSAGGIPILRSGLEKYSAIYVRCFKNISNVVDRT